MKPSYRHISVLQKEVVDFAPPSARNILDCTLGGGGHSYSLLSKFTKASLYGIDRESIAVKAAKRRLKDFRKHLGKMNADKFDEEVRTKMKATMIAHDNILAGSHQVMVAGGMESMSNTPYILPKARSGQRIGHGQIIDHMFLDGLEDAYEKGTLMGVFAERTAKLY